VNTIRKECGVTIKVAESVIDCITGAIIKNVRKGKKVKIVGFATFYRKKKKGRTFYNPQNQDPVKWPTMYYPKMLAHSRFKEAVKK
jgi:nucleoid DNA-binding protein